MTLAARQPPYGGEAEGKAMASKAKVPAIAYLRTSSAANVGADKDSDRRQREAGQECPITAKRRVSLHPIWGLRLSLRTGTIPTRIGLLLIGGDGSPDLVLRSTVKFVFVRPSRIALPSVP
jgi:hypothetical protein